jgi:3-isopropylmalate dehydrogenase
VALIRGDGIGPEVTGAALSVLNSLEARFDLRLDVQLAPAGDSSFREVGAALPEESLQTIRNSDACLKGPVGETAADSIVRLRQLLDLYANVRPVKNLPGVQSLASGVDFVIVRENTEDLYKGLEFEFDEGAMAIRQITKRASQRIAEFAFGLAERRKKRVVTVHKSNVLRKTDALFASVCHEVGKKHPNVELTDMYVDAAAMNLIRTPQSFDVLVTTNLYGDILSDEGAQLVGGLGLVPSANVGERYALFEPVHGSAPDIANRGISNPIAMFLATAMMLDWLAQSRKDPACGRAADALTTAVNTVLGKGVRTPDLGGSAKTSDVAEAVAREVAPSS